MVWSQRSVVAAGHICLDIIPTLPSHDVDLAALLTPGGLVEVGGAVLSTGGPVSNTGLALHRLGVPTRLMGKVGDDAFGRIILDLVRAYGPDLAAGMLVAPAAETSYTVVISPPGVDRVFLHCPGANNTFGAADVPYDSLAGVTLFHFGYPPVMQRMFADDGAELEQLLRNVQARGVLTSLDMCRPDPHGPAGRANWERILARALPHIDLFLPSFDELLFMLDRGRFEQLRGAGDGASSPPPPALLAELAERLLTLGAQVVVLKLGDRGLYVRTGRDVSRLVPVLGSAADSWRERELLTPCFQADVVGTTGCGDATIAGFLAAFLAGCGLEETLTTAVAVGACNVERPDALSGVPAWSAVQARIGGDWQKHPLPAGWTTWKSAAHATFAGPRDKNQSS